MIIFFDATVICQAQINPLARTGVWKIVEGLWKSLNIIKGRLDDCQLELIPFSLHQKRALFSDGDFSSDFPSIQTYPYDFHPASRQAEIANLSELISNHCAESLILSPYGPLRDALGLHLQGKPQIIHYIHDLIPVYNPAVCTDYSINLIQRKLSDIRTSDIVLLNSESTLQKFQGWWDTTNNDQIPPMLRVIEPGLNLDNIKMETCIDIGNLYPELASISSYFLSVSTLEPRKNILRMLLGFQRFKLANQQADDVKLLLVGADGWLGGDERRLIDQLVCESTLGVIRLGYVSDDVLHALYKNALALLQVSLDEGYALSVRYARAFGISCICSNIPPLNDLVSDLDVYVDPYSIESIADGMCQAFHLGGQRKQRFDRSWYEVANDIEPLLTQSLNSASPS